MLTQQTCAALLSLQDMSIRTGDLYHSERIERAMDEIIRLNSTKPAAFQVRSGMANASKVLQTRRAIVHVVPMDSIGLREEPGSRDDDEAIVDLRLWLESSAMLSASQKRLLIAMWAGEDSESLSTPPSVSATRMRERISRVRRAAREAYRTEYLAREVAA